jgi:hypothetical protein
MSAPETNEMFEVLSRVKTWVPEMRIVLTRKILETSTPSKISEPPRKMSLDQVFGLLKTDSPPPDDEECAKIVEEERLRKHV